MANLARNYSQPAVFQDYGQVVGAGGTAWSVRTENGVYRAFKAVSCLVRPEIGDRVLVSIGPDSREVYILAILARTGESRTVLDIQNDAEIRTESGRLEISARDGLDLASAGDISLVSSDLRITAAQGEVNCPRLSFWGRVLEGRIEAIKLIGQTIDTVVERLHQRIKRYYRFVEGAEQVRAGRLNCQVKDSLVLRGRFSQVTAEEDVHVDGKQIHIG